MNENKKTSETGNLRACLDATMQNKLLFRGILIGRENIPKELIIQELGLNSQTSMISINLKSLNEKLKSIKWIKSSVIERRLPDTIIIKLEVLCAGGVRHRSSRREA